MAVVAVGARSVALAQPSGTKEMCRRKEGEESEEIAYVPPTASSSGKLKHNYTVDLYQKVGYRRPRPQRPLHRKSETRRKLQTAARATLPTQQHKTFALHRSS